MILSRSLLLSVLAASAATAAAQSGGPLMALGQGLSVDPVSAVPGLDGKSIATTACDFEAAAPVALPPAPGMPDFTTLPFPPGIDIDALSLGLDWVLADATGVVVVPPNHWGAISFSVRRSAVGAPGSLIAVETATAGGAAADVFAYVLPGSALPAELVGVPFRALDSKEINLDVPGTPANIDAHDAFVGLVYRDNPQLAALLPPPTVFFSVTAATTAAIPAGWLSSPPMRSGATVFATTWSIATASWSPPTTAFAPAAFGLSATEDLDALALDLMHGRVLFSTDRSLLPLRDAVLYSNLGSGIFSVYRLPNGTPIGDAIGLGPAPDDIDGICALDPGDITQPSQIRLERMLGSVGPPAFPGFATPLQASAYRHSAGGVDTLVSYMTGWPPPGTPAPGAAAVAWSANGNAGPWEIAGIVLRPNPGSPYANFEGHPEKWQPAVPPQFHLGGVPITIVWAALDASTMVLSLPVTIVL